MTNYFGVCERGYGQNHKLKTHFANNQRNYVNSNQHSTQIRLHSDHKFLSMLHNTVFKSYVQWVMCSSLSCLQDLSFESIQKEAF